MFLNPHFESILVNALLKCDYQELREYIQNKLQCLFFNHSITEENKKSSLIYLLLNPIYDVAVTVVNNRKQSYFDLTSNLIQFIPQNKSL